MAELAEITAANQTLASGSSWPQLTTAIADGGMIIITVFLIVVGAYRSVPPSAKSDKEFKEKLYTWHPRGETLVHVASLFVSLFKVSLDDEHDNLTIINFLFLLSALYSLTPLLSSLVALLISTSVKFQFCFNWRGFIWTHRFFLNFLVSIISSGAICLWYLLKGHWIANNILGFAFAVRGIELLQYNNILFGFKLLGGLLIGEIFQVLVFGMNSTMVLVPQSFNSPIQLIFPLENGLSTSRFIMLRFYEIVIPGVFIAHLLRFDTSLKRKLNYYFISTTAAYTFGLVITYLEMHYYCQTKPALLFLLPACLGTPVLIAVVMGDFKAMYSYKDHSPAIESNMFPWFEIFTIEQRKNEENPALEEH